MAVKLSELLALPVEDRLQLVEVLWESVAECPEALELMLRRSRSSIVGSQRMSVTRLRAYLGLS